jgi:hypothetical protein
MEDRSAGNGLLQRAAAVGRARQRGRTTLANQVTTGRPSQCPRLRLGDLIPLHII